MQDLVSAGGNRLKFKEIDSIPLEDQWELFSGPLDFSRTTSYYGHFIKGFQKLYDFDEMYFTGSNIKDLSAQVESNYSDFDSWYASAFKQAGFDKEGLKNDQYSEDQIIGAMIKFPKLIERPIVVNNGKAVIGRPPSLVLDIIE